MRITSVLVACLTLAVASGPLVGQAGDQPKASPAKRAFDALEKEYKAAYDKYIKEIRKIAATDEHKAAIEARDYKKARELRSAAKNPNEVFVQRFTEAATKHEAHPDAAHLRGWLFAYTRGKDATLRLLEKMEARDLKHPAIKKTAEMLMRKMRVIGAPRCREFLAKVIDGNENKEVIATALFSRVSLARYDREATDAHKKQAEEDAVRIQKLVPGSILALRADGPRFQRDNLQMGMTAPDIVGDDLDGVKFKLSDYRGKVVLLDFWGDW